MTEGDGLDKLERFYRSCMLYVCPSRVRRYLCHRRLIFLACGIRHWVFEYRYGTDRLPAGSR